jgi:SagB-type dehydrogenase family enzyme
MDTKLSRHDFSYLISAVLILVAAFTAVTGLASDVWDLNDFFYHKYAGYLFAFLGLTHVILHWRRLSAYVRWRLSGHPRVRRSVPPESRRGVEKAQTTGDDEANGRAQLSRRLFLPLAAGGVAGFALGRSTQPQPELPYGGDLGTLYHEWSKPGLRSFLGAVADWGRRPNQYKNYAAPQKIDLPEPGKLPGPTAEETIRQRRSRRNYSGRDMTLEELSELLFHTAGITGESWGQKLRAAPSAGALYPIETYLVIHRVGDLETGLYHYAVEEHALELLQAGDLRREIAQHGLMQEFLGQANLVFVFTAIFQRLRWKYQERSYRYALIEAGHLGQNLYLTATSMGMGACAAGAFVDDDLNSLLGVDGQEEAAVYMLAAGRV